MMFWAYFSIFTWIVLGVGIIYLIVQAIRHRSKKFSLIIIGVGILLSICSFAGFSYTSPMYGGVNIERSDYNTIKRATKDGKALSKLSKHSSDKQVYDGEKAGKNLCKIIKSIPETYDNHIPRSMAIDGLPASTSTNDLNLYDSQYIESLVRMSANVLSKKVTPKDEGSKGQSKVYEQIMTDSGYSN
ncbi:hypothetical protein [Lactiplantibacillus plantarum]|uniref:hypothetical protein n=1 Tax=Lactiplantibacillus plantarum TaxID=1590 RepID=UPI000F8EC9A5|nr:hypothetical protein [Lactiplantibacillus plantarum]RUS41140.1 hypothetical protein EL800_14080 [Lactiplantibacillus plantarum]RXK89913.1 hypothetical protein ETC33_14160 [Lactiplantibacillus plantarum]